MTAATIPTFEALLWRPSAALRVAYRPTKKRSLAAAVLAAIVAFTLTLTLASAGTASAATASFPETRVAAQTNPTQAFVGPEGAETPATIGENGAWSYDGVLGCGVAPRGTANDTANVLPSSGKTYVGTPRGTVYDVPEGWAPRVADNGKGTVDQKPGAVGNTNSVRIMEPTPKYPDGCARVYNGEGNGQPIDVFGKPGPQPATHIPETYQGSWPGWPQ